MAPSDIAGDGLRDESPNACSQPPKTKRSRPAFLAGAAAAAFSFSAAVFAGTFGTSGLSAAASGSAAAGLGASASLGTAVAAIPFAATAAGLVVASVLARSLHQKSLAREALVPSPEHAGGASGQPLLLGAAAKELDPEAVAPQQAVVEPKEDADGKPPEADDLPVIRRPIARRKDVGGKLMAAARKRVHSHVAVLMNGVVLPLEDKRRSKLQLLPPRWEHLSVRLVKADEESDGPEDSVLVPLTSIALRLEGCMLELAWADEIGEIEADCKAERAGLTTLGDEERGLRVRLRNSDMALEMALALKALRGHADTGCGVADWQARPRDRLGRPPPAE